MTKQDKAMMIEQRNMAIYLFLKLGKDNNAIYLEISASTDYTLDVQEIMEKKNIPYDEAKTMVTHKPTETMLELQGNKNAVEEYFKAHNVNPSDYLTAYDKKFPKWALKHKPALFVVERGAKKKDYPDEILAPVQSSGEVGKA